MTTTFFQRVEALCRERNMNISDLGPAAGIGVGTIPDWRKGAKPRMATLIKVAAYFNVPVAYLTGDTNDPIDYANLDTSGFNRTTYEHILKKCKGSVEQANREYLEFEQAQAQDALSDPNRLAIYQNNGGTVGVQGHAHAPVKIINGTEYALSEQESELLRVFADLSLIEQSKVLVYAAELRDKNGGS
ncbi:MAG: helix-turn-helix transcriptional regulator [Clostridiales bacterium]|nr:helix-turn-helix transcriptional regulator [Clostridiales bacterium]